MRNRPCLTEFLDQMVPDMDPETRRKRYVKLLDAFILFNHGALLGDPEPKVVQPLINAIRLASELSGVLPRPANRPSR